MLASDEIVSTSSSASWSPSAARTSAIRLVTPVEVSLWTTITARVSGSSASAIRSGSAPWRQSPSSQVTRSPSFSAIARQSVAKCPVSDAITLSPGESVLTIAASQAPVPEAG